MILSVHVADDWFVALVALVWGQRGHGTRCRCMGLHWPRDLGLLRGLSAGREVANDTTGMRFLRFRLGCHHLRVNTGRWVQPPLPRRQRVCLRCHSACLDDETHCLLVCSHPTMVDAREKMHAAIPVAFRHDMATYAQFWGVLGR